MEKKIQKKYHGAMPLSLKVNNLGLSIQQRPKCQKKMALTHSFLMSLFPDYALLQWFTKMSNFCFFIKKFRGRTKPLAAIFGFWYIVLDQKNMIKKQKLLIFVNNWRSANFGTVTSKMNELEPF